MSERKESEKWREREREGGEKIGRRGEKTKKGTKLSTFGREQLDGKRTSGIQCRKPKGWAGAWEKKKKNMLKAKEMEKKEKRNKCRGRGRHYINSERLERREMDPDPSLMGPPIMTIASPGYIKVNERERKKQRKNAEAKKDGQRSVKTICHRCTMPEENRRRRWRDCSPRSGNIVSPRSRF